MRAYFILSRLRIWICEWAAEEAETETTENGEEGESAPVSEEFQKLQSELDERDRLAREKVEEVSIFIPLHSDKSTCFFESCSHPRSAYRSRLEKRTSNFENYGVPKRAQIQVSKSSWKGKRLKKRRMEAKWSTFPLCVSQEMQKCDAMDAE